MYKTAIAKIALVLVAAGVAGCQGQALSSADSGLSAGPGSISVYELASRVGLEVKDRNETYIKLADSANTVLLFTHIGGECFVNATPICPVGETSEIGGVVFVPSRLADRIKQSLRSHRPVFAGRAATVVIDPGHGGKDPGAVSCMGFYEKTVTLNVSRKTAEILHRSGVKVIMTRNSDVFIPLEARAEVANRNSAELFVSIHADSCLDSSVQGSTVYVARAAGRKSLAVAKKISTAISAHTGITSKGVRKANYRVLVRTRCPAVLVEMGYISNCYEASVIRQSSFQQRVSAAIAEGVLDWLSGI